MRKVSFLAAFTTAGALLGIAPAAAQPTPEVTAFCDAALKVDDAVADVGEKGPTEKQRRAIDQALSGVESTTPPEVAADIQSIAGIIRTALQNKEDPSANPAFGQNLTNINQYRYSSCGYQQVEVTGIEYEFQSIPKTLKAGAVAFKFTDNGAELHELMIMRLKSGESAKKAAGLGHEQLEKREVGETEAGPGQTSYLFADLNKTGRYAAVCHLPVGSTSERAAEQAEKKHAKEHWREGMLATFKVEKGTTTSSTVTSAP